MKTVLLALALFGTAQAACDTSYLLPPGTFTYQSPDLGTKTVKNVVVGDSVKSTTTEDGDSSTITYTCQNGRIIFDAGDTNIDLSMFPQGSQWRPGYTWTFQSRASAGGSKVTLNGTGRIVGLERVTTPAGSFNAYRMELTYTLNLGSEASKLPKGVATKMMAPHKNTYWFARGVGVVKTVGDLTETLVKVGR